MSATITGKNNDRAYAGAMKPVAQALREIAWIAELSKADAPPDEAGLRRLMNKMALGARKARALLENALAASARSEKAPGLIPVHGGYRKLKSFQVAEVVYDGTTIFCDRFINKRSRTHDQMVQGARSGRQNTAEGSMASATSKKTEIKLTNVAKASLEELLLDYQDFLRQRRMRQWDKNDPEALAVRGKYRSFPDKWFENIVITPRAIVGGASGDPGESDGGNGSDKSDKSDRSDRSEKSDKHESREQAAESLDKPASDRLDPYGVAAATPEVAANTLICLVNQAIFLLKRQIQRLEKDFVEQGGFTERLYRVRSERRKQQ